jgi:hypothetical protein
MATHFQGLRCPACGHEWPGHAMRGAVCAAEGCPRCSRPDDPLDLPPVGLVHAGSVEVAGCDRHSAALPCPFCC